MQTIGVKFNRSGNNYNFIAEYEYEIGDKVIVETERGLQLGIVEQINVKTKNDGLHKVIRKATDKDYDAYLKNLNDAQKALKLTKREVKNLGLKMGLIDANFSLDKKQLLFNFVAEERIDFRELVRILASKFHARIELHQIGVRDKAKVIGGIGMCGRKLCCSNCLTNLNAVNINMVKNQNIALNPAKINGLCGRLLCCFNYENDVYEENRQKLPQPGEKIKYKGKLCPVTEVDVLNMKYKIKVDNDTVEEVTIDDRLQ